MYARAHLKGTSLVGTDLIRAYTLFAHIEGTDLSQVVHITQAQLDLACGNSSTKIPKHLQRLASWTCPKDD